MPARSMRVVKTIYSCFQDNNSDTRILSESVSYYKAARSTADDDIVEHYII